VDRGYLFGTDIQLPLMKGNNCVVRVGGGYVHFEEYIMKHHNEYYEKLKTVMKDTRKSFHEVFSMLLLKHIKDRKQVLLIMKKLQWWVVRQAFYYGSHQNN